MTFHPEVWIAVAATAPVIALAAVVAAGDSSRVRTEIDDRNRRLRPSHATVGTRQRLRAAAQWVNRWSLLNSLNLAFQTAALLFALLSLTWWRPVAPPLVVVGDETLGIVLLLLVTYIGVQIRQWLAEVDKDEQGLSS
jgi:hypothetical protein